MNILLVNASQISNEKDLRLEKRQHDHLRKVLKVQRGDTLKIGVLNGKLGTALITKVTQDDIQLEIKELLAAPPAQLPCSLIVALPRPQMIKRILQTVACMGVQNLHFIQSSRVEKSFWQSPQLSEESILAQLVLGLEQGGATQLPSVSFHKRFIPFIEDELNTLTKGSEKIIAHLGDYPKPGYLNESQHCTIAIGPEGGFTQKEVELFIEAGFNGVQLGKRILKVETAIPVILAKLFQ